MKIVLSRKGFDSSSGRMPSPIFPDGKIVSLPIPSSSSPIRINDLNISGYDIVNVVLDISNKRVTSQQSVHLDPDLDYRLITDRPKDWRGAFGQVDIAQKHLSNTGVGKGDLFIYFGWFRKIELYNQVWKFKQNAPDLHLIYGWLFVEEVISVYGNEKGILEKYPWLKHHPHLCGINDVQNTIYVGSQTLPLEIGKNKSGYGVFRRMRDVQVLTDTSQGNRSVWKLPICFYPSDGKPPLSYHAKKERWIIKSNEWVMLNSVGRGQEFVLDTAYYPKIDEWLIELFS
jgi:hypothetical protein